jgi:mannobiose 2-epimerase
MTLQQLKIEASRELQAILDYWAQHTVDENHGGFLGRIDHFGRAHPLAEKGSVLNARIAWSFSAAYQVTGNAVYLEMAKRAFDYIQKYFVDRESGGVYWTVGYKGQPAETKKQIYAQAFVIYACSEYFKASKDAAARELAIELFELIERYSFDEINDGYFEAFTKEWKDLADLRLSDKDANEKKTMNTHLHILEAYSNLYTVWPDSFLQIKIKHLLAVFYNKIIDPSTGHQHLFFDEHWNVKGHHISYGHDIEASWLLLEAAESVGDEVLISRFRKVALQMTDASFEGMDQDGGLWHELNEGSKEWIREKHWWPQAEALVGFINAWQLSGENRYSDAAIHTWQFIKNHIIDKKEGEWFWGVTAEDAPMQEDKAGLWKCPYHNSRACLELMKRL